MLDIEHLLEESDNKVRVFLRERLEKCKFLMALAMKKRGVSRAINVFCNFFSFKQKTFRIIPSLSKHSISLRSK